jgi:predicted amidohydrolase YtcJ
MRSYKTISTLSILFFMAVLFSGCNRAEEESSGVVTEPEYADLVYSGGPIITVNDEQPEAGAVAVRAGRILAVGSRAEMAPLTGPETRMIDLAGRTLAPGFIDGHAHVSFFGTQAVGANLLAPPDGGVANIDQLVEVLEQFESSPDLSRTGWIYGIGYDDSVLVEGRHPTRDDLDRVSTEIPVIALHISGHFSAVNSKGLELIGYDENTEDPPGGVIRRRDGSNEPNGVLEELASIPVVMDILSPKTPEDARYFLEKGLEMAMSFGYTTAQEGRAFSTTHQMLAAYAEQTGFPIDVVSYIDYSDTSPLFSPWYGSTYRGGYRVGGIKITLDGSPQGRTAWRTQPYLIPPEGQEADYAGYPAFPDNQALLAIVDQAYANHWQLLVHANGDAAVDQMLDAIEPAVEKYGLDDRRTTLIHGQYVRMDQLDRMVDLDIVASLFPMHTFYWGDWHEQLIGWELGQKISPTRSALDRGLLVTSHSDAPVALPNLMQVMWATVNRVSRSGQVIGPDERLTPYEALKAITIWSAKQHFEEDRKGSIEAGKLADLVILSDNPLTVAPERINQILVLETIKQGKAVWTRY